jgi:hypothetical protein
MQGRLIAVIGAVAGCSVAACLAIPAVGNGAPDRRGGNHGCAQGVIFSDHWFEPGDNISFGYQFEPAAGPPPSSDQDVFYARNVSSEGGTPSSLICGSEVGAFTNVESRLGPGDDSVRLDGQGIPPDEDGSFRAVPRAVDSLLKGGGGRDSIRGHKGFDTIRAGSGADVVNVYDGVKDSVNCGTGRDKAIVDRKDDTSRCEDLVVQIDPT